MCNRLHYPNSILACLQLSRQRAVYAMFMSPTLLVRDRLTVYVKSVLRSCGLVSAPASTSTYLELELDWRFPSIMTL